MTKVDLNDTRQKNYLFDVWLGLGCFGQPVSFKDKNQKLKVESKKSKVESQKTELKSQKTKDKS